MGRPTRFDFMLTNGLTNWIKDNQHLSAAIDKPNKVFIYEVGDILHINLNLFNEAYLKKFIRPNPNLYIDQFLAKMEKPMFSTLSFIRIEDYHFTFKIKYGNEVFYRKMNYYFLTKREAV